MANLHPLSFLTLVMAAIGNWEEQTTSQPNDPDTWSEIGLLTGNDGRSDS